jgi:hypothetical protein
MATFNVTLRRKGSFNGKNVSVQATDKIMAMEKAVMIQPNPGWWIPMTAKVVAETCYKFKHKGLRYTR